MEITPEVTVAENPVSSRRRRIVGRVLDVVVVLVSVALGIAFAVSVVQTTVPVGPVTLNARMAFGWPAQTTLHIPPFGSVHAQTHAGPARLDRKSVVEGKSVYVGGGRVI